MADQKIEKLVSPDGKRDWTPESPEQATNLRARGWKPKTAPATKASGSKSEK